MNSCRHEKQELISAGGGWGEYRCRECGRYGIVDYDTRWGNRPGVFMPKGYRSVSEPPRRRKGGAK
jgi:hypothetical protein